MFGLITHPFSSVLLVIAAVAAFIAIVFWVLKRPLALMLHWPMRWSQTMGMVLLAGLVLVTLSIVSAVGVGRSLQRTEADLPETAVVALASTMGNASYEENAYFLDLSAVSNQTPLPDEMWIINLEAVSQSADAAFEQSVAPSPYAHPTEYLFLLFSALTILPGLAVAFFIFALLLVLQRQKLLYPGSFLNWEMRWGGVNIRLVNSFLAAILLVVMGVMASLQLMQIF